MADGLDMRKASIASVGTDVADVKGTVVLDNGSGYMKGGFAGEDHPRCKTDTMVGRRKHPPEFDKVGRKLERQETRLYLGDEAQNDKHDLILEHPVENGIVKNWDHIEALWDYVLAEQLEVNVEEYFVLLTDPPMNPKAHREKVAEIMFEAFNVPGLWIGMQAIMALYSEGLTTGLVLDIGDGVTHVVPVFDGYAISNAILRQDLAGRNLTEYMSRLLRSRGYNFTTTSAQQEVVREIKEKLSYVALDYDAEVEKAADLPASVEKSYELPDGQTVTLGEERFQCGEALFNPSVLGKELMPLPDLVCDCLKKCPLDTRKNLINSVLVSGGTTMIDGMPERLRRDLQDTLSGKLGVRSLDLTVNAPKDRQSCVWRGGSVLGALSTFEDMVVLWEEYEEVGPRIMTQKNKELTRV